MMDTHVIAPLAQFGSAGLIAVMWIAERRAATEREAQLREAHDRLGRAQLELGELVEVVRRNTRAMVSLRGGNRELAMAIDRLVAHNGAHPEDGDGRLMPRHGGATGATEFVDDDDDDIIGR